MKYGCSYSGTLRANIICTHNVWSNNGFKSETECSCNTFNEYTRFIRFSNIKLLEVR